MKVNFCPSCGVKIHGQTRFCSKCGAELSKLYGSQKSESSEGDFKDVMKQFIESFVEGNTDLLKELSARVEKGQGLEKGMFFAVEMKGDKPVIKSGDAKDLEKILKSLPMAPSKMFSDLEKEGVLDFEQIEAEVEKTQGGQKISLKLPGVSSIDDVVFNETDNSLEIMGKSDGTIYFSKVPMEGGFEIKEAMLDKDILTVEIT